MQCHGCGSQVADNATVCPKCGADLANDSLQRLRLGTRLGNNGRYSVGRVLGQGGYGITYQGADSLLQRGVAIKELFLEGSVRNTSGVFPPSTGNAASHEKARTRFLQEARTLAKFDHPGIVKVLDTFEENRTAYIVMEFLRGQTLDKRLQEKTRLEVSEARKVMEMVMGALEVVHQAGILHRDIKPANLMWMEGRGVVLLDFGLARNYEAGQMQSQSQQAMTQGYAPLEQYASKAQLGPYTDLYALGATMYHLLTGERPVSPNDRVVGIDFDPLPADVPPEMVTAINRCLEIRFDARVQSVAELRTVLAGGN